MRFKGITKSTVATFENDWVRQRILVLGLFDRLNPELKSMIYVLIETGARMSEICNLTPNDIHLDDPVPYISIRPREDRELKTVDSERDLPLIGIALEAMKSTPQGYETYRGKGTLVSANLMKAFRIRDLLPTKNHVIYSFIHLDMRLRNVCWKQGWIMACAAPSWGIRTPARPMAMEGH